MWRYGCGGGGGGPSAIHTCLPGKAWSGSPPCMDTRPWARHTQTERARDGTREGERAREDKRKQERKERTDKIGERGGEERKKVGVDGRIGQGEKSGSENSRIGTLHTATKTDFEHLNSDFAILSVLLED